MAEPAFPGAEKAGASILSPLERRFAGWVIPRLPRWLETHHLTMMTVVWCALIVLGGYLAAADIRWLWLSSAAVLGQYVTDHLDGKLGKYRDTGLVRWGYFMDHFLDYFFLCAILAGYAFLVPEPQRVRVFYLLIVLGGYLVLAYLAAEATGSFRVSAAGLGPTEFRLGIVAVNTVLIAFGAARLGTALLYVTGGAFLVLVVLTYGVHRKVWRFDMERKAEKAGTPRA